jgi:hypothetical protein
MEWQLEGLQLLRQRDDPTGLGPNESPAVNRALKEMSAMKRALAAHALETLRRILHVKNNHSSS